jgi:hypothetical protein
VSHLQARIRGLLEFNTVVLDPSRIAVDADLEGHAVAVHFAFLDWGACIVAAEDAAAGTLYDALSLAPFWRRV